MNALGTLGGLIDDGYQIGAHCLNLDCRRYSVLDLPALAVRLGRDHASLHKHLAPKLRCSACGGRRVGLTLIPPNQPKILPQTDRTNKKSPAPPSD